MAAYKELERAWREGFRSLGLGVSDCPYTRTGLSPMNAKDKALADAWICGLRVGEAQAKGEEAQDRADLASSPEQRNDLSNAPDLLVPIPPPVRPTGTSSIANSNRESDRIRSNTLIVRHRIGLRPMERAIWAIAGLAAIIATTLIG